MILATMMGEGRKTRRESSETMMMMPAALSRGSTARSDSSWLPTCTVEIVEIFRYLDISTVYLQCRYSDI